MKLLQAINYLDGNESDTKLLKNVIKSIENRMDWMEDREPEYDCDEWYEKYSYLEEALEYFEDALDYIKEVQEGKEQSSMIATSVEEGIAQLEEHQDMYGGLGRWRL